MQKKQKGVSLKIVTDVTLEEISQISQRVTRTPHVGNECLHGVVHEILAAIGNIFNLYYDRTTRVDIYHHPSYIVVGGKKIKIAPTEKDGKDILTTHLDVKSHMFRLDLVFPESTKNRSTYSQFIQKYKKEYEEMVLITGKTVFDMGLWSRFVKEDGVIINKKPASWQQILSEGIFQVTQWSEKSGWIMPNILNILSMIFIDDREYKSGKVYQISGAEMYRYIQGMMNDIDTLWNLLVKKAGASESVELIMFPTGNARFGAFNQADYYKLELMLSKRKEIDDFNETKSEYFRSLSGNKPDPEKMKEFNTRGISLQHEYQDLCWENRDILYAMSDASFTSQYDMQPGQKIHIHPFCLKSSIEELDKMVKEMKDNIKRREKRKRIKIR